MSGSSQAIMIAQKIAAGGGGLPAWITANANSVGTWYQMPGTNISSVEPASVPAGATGPTSKVDAWCSFSVDPTNSVVYSAANGGHTDYAGNEVDAIALNVSSPAWVESRAPTGAGSVTTTSDRYSDSRPASRHSYYGQLFDNHGGDSRLILVGGGSRYQNGGVVSATDAFGVASNDWSALATLTGQLAGWEVPMVCRDTRNGDIFMSGAPSAWVMAKWTKASNSWSDVNSSCPMACYKACSAWDSTRNKIFILGGQYSASHTYEPDTDTFAAITLSGAAAGSVSMEFAGMVYVPSLDVFLVRGPGSGGTVYQITPSGVCTTFSTSGGTGIAGTVATQICNRFLYVPVLKGCVVFPTYTGSGWYLRVEA